MNKELSVWDILKSPVVTEKSVLLKEESSEEDSDRNLGQVLTFRVERKAGKEDIRRAVEEIFDTRGLQRYAISDHRVAGTATDPVRRND